jgi:hypothetical protein
MESAIERTEPLGKLTRYVSGKRRNYDLQGVAADLLPNERVSWCSRRAKAPVIEIRKKGDNLYYYGLAVCGSVWVCPVCAERISLARRNEISLAQERWVRSGGSIYFITLTYQHSIDDRLEDLLSDMNTAWRQFRGGRKWIRIADRYKLAASVANLEITYSLANGWHPHKHIIFFSRLSESEFDVAAFERELKDRWISILKQHERYASDTFGLSVVEVNEPIAGYFTKWSSSDEIALSERKRSAEDHHTMFELLELASEGVKYAAYAFREYAKAVKGKRKLSWGKGDRDLLGLGEEVEDITLAAEDPDQETKTVCVIPMDLWALVCKYEKRGELLFIAATYGSSGVGVFLGELENRYRLGSGEP